MSLIKQVAVQQCRCICTSKNCFSLDSGPCWVGGVTFSIL